MNIGQTDPRVRYITRGAGLTSFLTDSENVIVLSRRVQSAQSRDPLPAEQTVVRLKLDGARPSETFEGLEKSQAISNYFIGNDPSKWVTNVPRFREIRAAADPIPASIWSITETAGNWSMTFVSNPATIRIKFGFSIRAQKPRQWTLRKISSSKRRWEVSTQRKPIAYQEIGGKRREVKASYSVREGKIRFTLGAWDRNRELIIDPILEYSTYLGGRGDDFGYGIAVDLAGEAFVVGSTTSPDFPQANPLQGVSFGNPTAFVTKFNSTGTAPPPFHISGRRRRQRPSGRNCRGQYRERLYHRKYKQ